MNCSYLHVSLCISINNCYKNYQKKFFIVINRETKINWSCITMFFSSVDHKQYERFHLLPYLSIPNLHYLVVLSGSAQALSTAVHSSLVWCFALLRFLIYNCRPCLSWSCLRPVTYLYIQVSYYDKFQTEGWGAFSTVEHKCGVKTYCKQMEFLFVRNTLSSIYILLRYLEFDQLKQLLTLHQIHTEIGIESI